MLVSEVGADNPHCEWLEIFSDITSILMTSRYFDNPAYSGELTISDYYVVEL